MNDSVIQVELTGDSEFHCLKIVFRARNAEQPLEGAIAVRQWQSSVYTSGTGYSSEGFAVLDCAQAAILYLYARELGEVECGEER